MSDDEARWQQGMSVCPNCDAEYPAWHSPIASLETLCNNCGWSSAELETGNV